MVGNSSVPVAVGALGGRAGESGHTRKVWRGYALALGSVLLCVLLRWVIDPFVGDRLPFAFFIVPVVLTAWLGGFGPSIFAAALSIVAGGLFTRPGRADVTPAHVEWIALVSYTGSALLVCWYAQWVRRVYAGLRQEIAGAQKQKEELLASIEELTRTEEALANANHELERDLTARTAEADLLRARLQAENDYLRLKVKSNSSQCRIVGQSRSIQHALAQAQQVASTDATVLLLGETGTGKELLASWIHHLSPRRNRAMVSVNCAVMPAPLIESELFGREKGAFTGSLSRQVGRFELADGSTVFLDEVGELPPEAQSKLLRVLESKQIERLGNPRPITVDVRIMAATNRNLERAVQEGTFRQDLFYRLNVFPITVPPLRDRCEDIPPLVWAFVDEFARTFNKNIESIERESMDALQKYAWPGNVRELRNLIERAMIVATGPRLRIELPSLTVLSPAPVTPAAPASPIKTMADLEREHVLSVLSECGWRIRGGNGAAEKLGIKPTTLESRMQKLGIHRPGRSPG